jgi:tetratricopeptide (TPR) repeat protein
MLRSAVVDHPTNAEAQYLMGRARLGAGNYQDSMHYLDRAIELNPQRADYKAYAAEAHQRRATSRGRCSSRSAPSSSTRASPAGTGCARDPGAPGRRPRGARDINRACSRPHASGRPTPPGRRSTTPSASRDEAIGSTEIAVQHDNRHGDWFYNLGRLLADRGPRRRRGAGRRSTRPAPSGRGSTRRRAWFVQGTRQLADLERARNPTEARRLYLD